MSDAELLICADACMHSAETIKSHLARLDFSSNVIHIGQEGKGGITDDKVVSWAMEYLRLNGHKVCFLVTYDRRFERRAEKAVEKAKKEFPDKEIKIIIVRDNSRNIEKVIEALRKAYEEWQRAGNNI